MNYEEYEAKYGIKREPESESAALRKYALYCYNANVIVYLYNTLCINADKQGENIDRSANGYVLWLYAAGYAVNAETVHVLNTALEIRGIDIRVQREISIEAPSLGRRTFLGNRHVFRLERPGIRDLIGHNVTDPDIEGWMFPVAAAFLPKLAQWHMSYVDVDETYAVGYKRSLISSTSLICYILRENKTVLSMYGP